MWKARVMGRTLGVLGALAFYGCSSDQKQVGDEVDASKGDEAQEVGDDNNANELKNDAGNADAAPNDPLAGNQQVAAAPAAAPLVPDNLEHVVRFVLADNTPVYQQPAAESAQAGVLWQGDPVVVAMAGDWAQISPDRFVSKAALSESLVPRNRALNKWIVFKAPPADDKPKP